MVGMKRDEMVYILSEHEDSKAQRTILHELTCDQGHFLPSLLEILLRAQPDRMLLVPYQEAYVKAQQLFDCLPANQAAAMAGFSEWEAGRKILQPRKATGSRIL